MEKIKTFLKTRNGLIVSGLILLVIGFISGMEYKVYQTRATTVDFISSMIQDSSTSARLKGEDAFVQMNLSSMRAQAELFYATNGNSYGSASNDCTGTLFTGKNGLSELLREVRKKSTSISCVTAITPAPAWAVSAVLPSGAGTFCVDSTGKSAPVSLVGYSCN